MFNGISICLSESNDLGTMLKLIILNALHLFFLHKCVNSSTSAKKLVLNIYIDIISLNAKNALHGLLHLLPYVLKLSKGY